MHTFRMNVIAICFVFKECLWDEWGYATTLDVSGASEYMCARPNAFGSVLQGIISRSSYSIKI